MANKKLCGLAKLIFTRINNPPLGFDVRRLIIGVDESEIGIRAMGRIDLTETCLDRYHPELMLSKVNEILRSPQ